MAVAGDGRGDDLGVVTHELMQTHCFDVQYSAGSAGQRGLIQAFTDSKLFSGLVALSSLKPELLIPPQQ